MSGGGGDCDPATTSTAARFHWWLVGAVSSMGTSVPAVGVGAVCDWAQKVSPLPVSSHWWRMVCPLPSVRAVAAS